MRFGGQSIAVIIVALGWVFASVAAEDPGNHLADVSADVSAKQARFITNIRQVTFEGRRAGENYFSADGSKMIFQSEREPGNPFYQMYVMDLDTGDTHRVSTGVGRTTCGWIHPDGQRVLFASSHHDPGASLKQKAELKRRESATGRAKRWVYDEYYDLYVANIDGTSLTNVTNVLGYDAECSFSPDGKLIAFSSNRHAYSGQLSKEQRKKLESAPEYFCEIYIMNADGANVQRLTHRVGDDGGPFFSPDGKRICWRYFSEDGMKAEVWTMNVDGTDKKQITRMGVMSWAPFYHPSGKYLLFTTSLHGFANFELYIIDVDGVKEPVRVTYADRFDGLGAFMPSGDRIAWTSNRTSNKQGQAFFGDWNHAEAQRALGLTDVPSDKTTPSDNAAPTRAQTSAEISADDIRTRVTSLESCFRDSGGSGGAALRDVAADVAVALRSIGFDSVEQRRAVQRDGCCVLARLRSDGPAGKEPLVIGAHVGLPGAGSPDADVADNTTGAAGLLEIAEYLHFAKADGKLKPRRDVIFAVFVSPSPSEDIAQVGLDFKSKGGSDPRRSHAAYVDIGAIGRLTDAVTLTGIGSSPIWRREIERRNVPVGVPIAMAETIDPRSLAVHIHAHGAPVLTASTVGRPGTQPVAPSGSPLNFDGAEKITRLISLIARSLATSDAIPEYSAIKSPKRRSGGPTLGTAPDFAASDIVGVRFSAVTKGGPADRAGLRGGDILVGLGSTTIANIHDYAKALGSVKVGDVVPIIVQRNGERLALTITVGARE